MNPTAETPTTTSDLTIDVLTTEAFAPFGTVIGPMPDGTPFGDDDATLELGNGTPRFYTMTVPARGLEFDRITRHRAVTQVLASAGGNEWYLAVAAATGPELADLDPMSIQAFLVPGDTAVMLAVGTWHAGPLFEGDPQSFFNLELSDTNEVDHETEHFGARRGVRLRLALPD